MTYTSAKSWMIKNETYRAVRLMVESFGREDFAEGVTSYMEERPPKF